MKISINIIEKYLKDNIVFENFRDNADLTIESFEIYVNDHSFLETKNLYLIKAEEILSPEALPNDMNFLCCGVPKAFNLEEYRHINLLILEGITEQKILNKVISVFHKYNNLEDRLNALIRGNASLQKIIDLATEMVEMPLNVLDLNHNVLAISSELDAHEDILWESIKAGHDYVDYDIVLESEPKISDLLNAPGSSIEMMSNISGHFIKVSLLLNKGHAVAFFGMHKTVDFHTPFEKHTSQIYDYIKKKLNRNLNSLLVAKVHRGLLYEEFLHDIFNRKFETSNEIEKLLSKLGFIPDSKYQIGLISFRKSYIRTEYYFAMMDYLERIISDSKCIAMDSFIYIIIPVLDEVYISDEIRSKLSEFLVIHNCFCMLSPVFISFEELYKINTMFKVVLAFIEKNDNRNIIYHYYEFANRYSMYLLYENMPAGIFVHPMVKKIIDYDVDHHSNYLETLKCYLRNESSISITSNSLHMHRNSLKYRINRIEKLLGVTFDDWKTREEFLFYMTYLENMDKFQNN